MSETPGAGLRALVLVRHGRTAYNATRRIQGQVDVDLDETGRSQATAVAPVLAAMEPVSLHASDLARARGTAAYVAAASGLEPVLDARLREYDLGEREGITHEEYAAEHPDEHARFSTGDFDVVPGGETAADVRARMVPALREALAATPPGRVCVVVSHGAAIRVGAAALLGWEPDAYRSLHGLGNCAWARLEAADPDAPVRLRAWNREAPGS